MGEPKKDFISRNAIDFIYYSMFIRLFVDLVISYQTRDYGKLTNLSTLHASGLSLKSFLVNVQTSSNNAECL